VTIGVFIPTKGRINNQRFHDEFIKHVPQDVRKHVWLVCPENELPGHRAHNRQAIGYDHENLSQSMDYIIHELAGNMGYDYIAMMDDDSKFAVRISPDAYNLRQADPEDFPLLLEKAEALLKEEPLVGVTIRQNSQVMFPDEVVYCTRQNQVHFVDVKFFKEHDIHPGVVEMKADFYMTLSVLLLGRRNAVIADFTVDQYGTSNAPGGVSLYRSLERMNAAAYRIQELFPNFITLRQKNQVWPGFTEAHLDVTVSWKQAYIAGLLATGQEEKAREIMNRPRTPREVDMESGLTIEMIEARERAKMDTRKPL